MKNKGQIAIFFIIAIVLISLIFFIIYYFKPLKTKEKFYIKENLEECIKQISINGLFELGKSGGYYKINGTLSNYYKIKLPIFFENEKNLLPEIEFFENEFSNYLKDNINLCFDNLYKFENEYKIKINHNKTNVKVKFKEKIKIEVLYEIIISKLNKNIILNSTAIELNFNFPEKYFILQKIIEEQKKAKNSLPIFNILELSKQKNFNFELIDLQNGYYIIILNFNNSLKDQPYTFSFLLSLL